MKVFLVLIALSLALLADSTKSWKSLPASTVAAIEMDFSEDLLLKLRDETSLGKTILSKKNIAHFVEIVKKHSLVNPKLAAILAELRSSGFTIDELARILNSKLGVALIPEDNDGNIYWSLVAWAEMGEGIASKIIASLSERNQGKVISLNGQKGLAFQNDWETSFTILSAHNNSLILVSSDIDEKLKNKSANQKQTKSSKLKFGFQQSKGEPIASKHVCSQRFSSFIHSHSGSGVSKFINKLNKGKLYKEKNPTGRRVIEYHVDFGFLKKLLADDINKLEMTGFSKLKHISGLVSYENKFMKSQSFVETETPRTSLLKLMDQPKISLEIEDWITDEVNAYSHMSMDMEFMYGQIKEMLSHQFGKAAVVDKLKEANMHCRAFIGHDIKTILSGFGNKVTFLDYGLSLKPQGVEYEPIANVAMIVPFNNKAVTSRVMEIITPFAEAQGIKRSDRKGFKGFVVKSDEIDGSLHMDSKNIIFTFGEDVCEKVLGSIGQSPKNKLKDNPQFKRLIKLLNVKEASMLSYGNFKGSIGDIYDLIEMAIKHKKVLAGLEKRDKAFIQELLENLPTVKDITNVIGIGGAYAIPEKEGLFLKGLVELP